MSEYFFPCGRSKSFSDSYNKLGNKRNIFVRQSYAAVRSWKKLKGRIIFIRSGAPPATGKHVARYNLSQVEMSATKPTTHLGNPDERVIWSSWQNKNNICLKVCGGSFRKERVSPLERKSIKSFAGQPLQRTMELWHVLACLCLSYLLLCMPRERI